MCNDRYDFLPAASNYIQLTKASCLACLDCSDTGTLKAI